MDPRRRRFLHLLAGAAALSAAPGGARAQSWPTRPVRIIVPFQPGGSTDIFARLAAQKLTERFGKQFYVENIAGATGNVGTAQAARAAPDGHTFLIAFSSYVANPTLFAKLPFDPDKDLVPVTLAVLAANVVTINPSLPARNLKELVALIKSNPGKYSYASGGVGTQAHLLGEMLRLSLALDLVHVPFNGAAPAIASAVAGHTPIVWSTLASAMHALRAGPLRAPAGARTGAGGEEKEALAVLPRHTDDRRGRLSADRRRQLGRTLGARRNAERDYRRAPARDRGNSCLAGREGALAGARLRSGRKHAEGIRSPHQGRDRDLGQDHPGGQHQAGIMGLSWSGRGRRGLVVLTLHLCHHARVGLAGRQQKKGTSHDTHHAGGARAAELHGVCNRTFRSGQSD